MVCRRCKAALQFVSGNTSNTVTHIIRHHPDVLGRKRKQGCKNVFLLLLTSRGNWHIHFIRYARIGSSRGAPLEVFIKSARATLHCPIQCHISSLNVMHNTA